MDGNNADIFSDLYQQIARVSTVKCRANPAILSRMKK
jgi:hypothetical protein